MAVKTIVQCDICKKETEITESVENTHKNFCCELTKVGERNVTKEYFYKDVCEECRDYIGKVLQESIERAIENVKDRY